MCESGSQKSGFDFRVEATGTDTCCRRALGGGIDFCRSYLPMYALVEEAEMVIGAIIAMYAKSHICDYPYMTE